MPGIAIAVVMVHLHRACSRERRRRLPPGRRPPPRFRPHSPLAGAERDRERRRESSVTPGSGTGRWLPGWGGMREVRERRGWSAAGGGGGLIVVAPSAISLGMMEGARGVRIAHVQDQALCALRQSRGHTGCRPVRRAPARRTGSGRCRPRRRRHQAARRSAGTGPVGRVPRDSAVSPGRTVVLRPRVREERSGEPSTQRGSGCCGNWQTRCSAWTNPVSRRCWRMGRLARVSCDG